MLSTRVANSPGHSGSTAQRCGSHCRLPDGPLTHLPRNPVFQKPNSGGWRLTRTRLRNRSGNVPYRHLWGQEPGEALILQVLVVQRSPCHRDLDQPTTETRSRGQTNICGGTKRVCTRERSRHTATTSAIWRAIHNIRDNDNSISRAPPGWQRTSRHPRKYQRKRRLIQLAGYQRQHCLMSNRLGETARRANACEPHLVVPLSSSAADERFGTQPRHVPSHWLAWQDARLDSQSGLLGAPTASPCQPIEARELTTPHCQPTVGDLKMS
jgi:hypothetical protein